MVLIFLSSLIALLAYPSGDWRVGQIKETEQVEAISAFAPHRIIKNAIIYAYTSRPSETDSSPFITAYNTRVRKGIVANNCLTKGTKVDILGITYVIEDKMNSRYGCNVFDVWHGDLTEARKWGKKTTDILVYVPQD